MTLNLQRVGETVIADGSITGAKLADDAVDFDGAKVTGSIDSDQLADGAVIEAKLAELAISTGKLQNNVVTLAKADRALNVHHLLTDDTEVDETGVDEVEVKTFKFIKAGSAQQGFVPKYITTQVMMKTSDTAKQASLKLYIDGEGTARITINSTSETYELLNDSADISDLSAGSHTVSVKLYNADAAGITYNQLLAAFLEKEQ